MQNLITQLNKNEVLRYLGYRGQEIPNHLDFLIVRCMDEMLHTITPKYLYRKFRLERNGDTLQIEGGGLVLPGKAIKEHLAGCEEIYILCATIGLGADRLIKTKMLSMPEEGVVFDSAATAAVEQLADLAEAEIAALCRKDGMDITWRFSAGYGDLPLTIQRELLDLMDAHRKIGLGVTENFLMAPSKSVTAIIGVTDLKKDTRRNKCDYCANRETCAFRKRGTQC